MNAISCLLIVGFTAGIGVTAWADEAADRAAMARVIAALNEMPQHPEVFTADSDAPGVLTELRKRKLVAFRPVGSDHPTVTISHEPWGEAGIDFPHTSIEILNPKVMSRTLRFITPDVALVDGACIYRGDETQAQTTPLLFVMKKAREKWKVASVRVLR